MAEDDYDPDAWWARVGARARQKQEEEEQEPQPKRGYIQAAAEHYKAQEEPPGQAVRDKVDTAVEESHKTTSGYFSANILQHIPDKKSRSFMSIHEGSGIQGKGRNASTVRATEEQPQTEDQLTQEKIRAFYNEDHTNPETPYDDPLPEKARWVYDRLPLVSETHRRIGAYGDALGIPGADKLRDFATGKNTLSEIELLELSRIDPKAAKERKSMQQTPEANLVDDVNMLRDMVSTLSTAIPTGIQAGVDAGQKHSDEGHGAIASTWKGTEGTRNMVGSVGVLMGESLWDFAHSPFQQTGRKPLEAVGNASLIVGPIAKVPTVAAAIKAAPPGGKLAAARAARTSYQAVQASREARKLLSPVRITATTLDAAAQGHPHLQTWVQYLGFGKAGLSDKVKKAIHNYDIAQGADPIRTRDAIDEILKLPPDEARDAWKIISGENLKKGHRARSGGKYDLVTDQWTLTRAFRAMDDNPSIQAYAARCNVTVKELKDIYISEGVVGQEFLMDIASGRIGLGDLPEFSGFYRVRDNINKGQYSKWADVDAKHYAEGHNFELPDIDSYWKIKLGDRPAPNVPDDGLMPSIADDAVTGAARPSAKAVKQAAAELDDAVTGVQHGPRRVRPLPDYDASIHKDEFAAAKAEAAAKVKAADDANFLKGDLPGDGRSVFKPGGTSTFPDHGRPDTGIPGTEPPGPMPKPRPLRPLSKAQQKALDAKKAANAKINAAADFKKDPKSYLNLDDVDVDGLEHWEANWVRREAENAMEAAALEGKLTAEQAAASALGRAKRIAHQIRKGKMDPTGPTAELNTGKQADDLANKQAEIAAKAKAAKELEVDTVPGVAGAVKGNAPTPKGVDDKFAGAFKRWKHKGDPTENLEKAADAFDADPRTTAYDKPIYERPRVSGKPWPTKPQSGTMVARRRAAGVVNDKLYPEGVAHRVHETATAPGHVRFTVPQPTTVHKFVNGKHVAVPSTKNVQMDSIDFLLKGDIKHLDPSDIKVVLHNADNSAEMMFATNHVEALVEARRAMTEMSLGLHNANIMPKHWKHAGKKLLSEDVLRIHLSKYLPDVYPRRLDLPDEISNLLNDPRYSDLVKALKSPDPNAALDDAAHSLSIKPHHLKSMKEAVAKHRAPWQERVKAGMVDPKELAYIMEKSLGDSMHTLRRYKILDEIADIADDALNNPQLTANGKIQKLPHVIGERTNFFDAYANPEQARKLFKGYKQMPEDLLPMSEFPVWGSLAGKWVDPGTYRRLMAYDDFAGALQKNMVRGTGAFKGNKLLWNPASWTHHFAGGGYNQILHGGDAADMMKAATELAHGARHTNPFYIAARDMGSISLEGKRAADMLTIGRRAHNGRDFARFIGNELQKENAFGMMKVGGRSALGLYEWAAIGNPVAQRLGRTWATVENWSRYAVFKRSVQRSAKAMGITDDVALKTEKVVKQAALEVERIHIPYGDLPLLVEKADRLGIAPFMRYTWGVTGVVIDDQALGPLKWQVGRQIHLQQQQAHAKEFGSQPEFHDGQSREWTPGERINMRWLNFMASPQETVGLKQGGAFGADPFKGGNPWAVLEGTIKQYGGPYKVPLEHIEGQNWHYQSEIPSEIKQHLKHNLYALGPSGFYHLFEKVLPSMGVDVWGDKGEKMKDLRGRDWKGKSPMQAIGHALGYRVEPSNHLKIAADIEKGFKQFLKDSERQFRKDGDAKARKKRDDWAKKKKLEMTLPRL